MFSDSTFFFSSKMSDFDDFLLSFGEHNLEESGLRDSSTDCYEIDQEKTDEPGENEEEEEIEETGEEEANHCVENETAPLDDVEYQRRRQELYCLLHWARQARQKPDDALERRLETTRRNFFQLQRQFAYLAACYERVERERDQLRMQLSVSQTATKALKHFEPSTPSMKEEESATNVLTSADPVTPPQRSKRSIYSGQRDADVVTRTSKRHRIPKKEFIEIN